MTAVEMSKLFSAFEEVAATLKVVGRRISELSADSGGFSGGALLLVQHASVFLLMPRRSLRLRNENSLRWSTNWET